MKQYAFNAMALAILISTCTSVQIKAEETQEPATQQPVVATEPAPVVQQTEAVVVAQPVQPAEPVVRDIPPVMPAPIRRLATTTIAHKKSLLPEWISRFMPWNLFKKKAAHRATTRKLKGMVGNHSEKIFWIIDQLKKKQTYLLSNRLILYGPPGNGKSTLARIIAVEAKWEFMPVSGANIVGSYLGEGAQKVEGFFESAAEKYRNTGRGVVIFIDEIDAIARANINYEAASRAEHQVATQALWLCLDRYKNHPGIFFICATNHFDKLDRTFLDRFSTNTIEIGYPDATTREEILNHYLKQYHIKLEDSLLKELVKNTDNLSIRSIEDLTKDIRISIEMDPEQPVTSDTIWELVRETKKKDVNQKKLMDSMRESWVRRGLDYTGLFLNCHNVYQIVSAWNARRIAANAAAFTAEPALDAVQPDTGWGAPEAE